MFFVKERKTTGDFTMGTEDKPIGQIAVEVGTKAEGTNYEKI